MHSTSEHGNHCFNSNDTNSNDTNANANGDSSSEGNLGELLPATDAALDPSDPCRMYADHFFDAISPNESLLEEEVIYGTVESMDSNEPQQNNNFVGIAATFPF